MSDTLAGFAQHPATRAGGSFVTSAYRSVWHSTEGSSLAGAEGAYRNHGGWPHFTVDPKTKERVQHYPLNVSSRALQNDAGGVETNRHGAIQVEIVGFAASMRDLPADQAAWLGTEVMRPIHRALGIPYTAPRCYDQRDGFTLASETAPQRMTYATWLGFRGACLHQHVPENDHWDAGALPLPAMMRAAQGGATTAPTAPLPLFQQEETEVSTILYRVDKKAGPAAIVTHGPEGINALEVDGTSNWRSLTYVPLFRPGGLREVPTTADQFADLIRQAKATGGYVKTDGTVQR